MAELLAPAGSLDIVRTAIDAGADAIYLGGKSFNARKFAHNLTDEELARAVTMAHLFNVKVYVTVNIVVADMECNDLVVYLTMLDKIGVDGIIVQDLGVAKIARERVPNLPLHGSTQMAVADIGGVRFLEQLGFTQVVLARELPISEIRAICAQAKADIEVFIHGASCMSYSGQCLMSSFIGGRSGNRGACAQPCRLPYQLLEGDTPVQKKESYLLSLRDLNASQQIDALLEAGVSSFKIEGRMKGQGYVRSVVSAYRSLIDSHDKSPKYRTDALHEAQRLLTESFNRSYQDDFLLDDVKKDTLTGATSGNLIPKTAQTDPGLERKIPIYGYVDVTETGNLRLACWDEAGHSVTVVSEYVPERAKNRPATQEWTFQQLSRLGGTVFSLQDVSLWDEGYMIPASVMNALRRKATDDMAVSILGDYKRPNAGTPQITHRKAHVQDLPDFALTVRVDTIKGVEAAATSGADRVILGGEMFNHIALTKDAWKRAGNIAKQYGISLWAATPRILWNRSIPLVRKELSQAIEGGVAGIYIGSMGAFTLVRDMALDVPFSADWSLNIFNTQSFKAYENEGLAEITISPEATLKQIQTMAKSTDTPIEVLGQGRIEMMVTEFCQPSAHIGKGMKKGCPGICLHRSLFLRDRRGEQFPVVTDQFCRNHILNSRDLDMAPYVKDIKRAGVRRLRIEGRGKSPEWIARQVQRYRRICDDAETMVLGKENQTVTRGHFFHGIL